MSRAVIVAPVPGTTAKLLYQPISGHAAVVEGPMADRLAALEGGRMADGLPVETLRDAGFVVDNDDDERRAHADAYATWLDEDEKTAVQLIVAVSFACNLRCTYCYQEVFDPGGNQVISPEMIDGFFRYVDRFHAGDASRPYLTLFGGEPLVDTPMHHDRLGRFMRGASERGIGVAVVTNGHDLTAYAEELARGGVREVQVTLDGPRDIHDARRPHRTGRGTFDRIVGGIQALVDAGVPVNLRAVVDKDNVESLPSLASFANERGWLALPDTRFKTQIGRNYELFGCAPRQGRDRLFGRAELWQRFVELAGQHPVLGQFHKPRLHGIGHLARTGELPAPTFDACPAAKKEWAFAPDGGLYGCTATVGNPRYRLGSYAPQVERDEAAIARWQERNTLSIKACAACSLAPVCGGGCGAVAAEHHGDVLAPDCRPVKELLGIGARHYGLA